MTTCIWIHVFHSCACICIFWNAVICIITCVDWLWPDGASVRGSILQHAQSAAAAFKTEIELSTSDLMRHLCHSVFYSPKCVFPTVRSLVSSFSEEPAKRVVQQLKNIIVFVLFRRQACCSARGQQYRIDLRGCETSAIYWSDRDINPGAGRCFLEVPWTWIIHVSQGILLVLLIHVRVRCENFNCVCWVGQ